METTAVTDPTQLCRIEEASHHLLESEKKFLVSPTLQNLNSIYRACRNLSDFPGNSSALIASAVSGYYQKKFHPSEPIQLQTIGIRDIAAFVSRLEEEYQSSELADIITRKLGYGPNHHEYRSRFHNIHRKIEEQLSWFLMTGSGIDEFVQELFREYGFQSRYLDVSHF